MTNMFLLNDFYTIDSTEQTEENRFSALISLNTTHPVFKGHFEQMPVVPGVFQTQIIKELLQQQLKTELQLTTGDNIKFMGMILPGKHPKVQLEVSYKTDENKYVAEAKLFYENTTFTKFKGTFISQ